MDLFTEPNPESCSRIGLDCGSCIHRSADSVATICRGLEPPALEQIFRQLYTSPGCHAMAPAFELAYRESLALQNPVRIFATAAA